jgi:hypothetical protein
MAPLLILVILVLAGCSFVASPEEANEVRPEPTEPTEPTSGEEDNRGTLIVTAATVPANQTSVFQFTGIPTGTISTGSTLVVTDLAPGTYTTTEANPAPDFDLTAVECNDSDSTSPSQGDAQTRTAVFNLDPGETIRCTFTNTQRGSVVVETQANPDGAAGSFTFTGTPSGTIPTDGTLVVANLAPGTYTTTERDPRPEFDLTAVDCDDGGSTSPSQGDAQTRTAVFNLDPGELIRCTFTNARRSTAVVASRVSPEGAEGSFTFTGVPSGTIGANGTLVAADLPPGTYTTTEVDPSPGFELTDVSCDDGGSTSASSGDATTRSAVYNLDPGETVQCTFTNTRVEPEEATTDGSSDTSDGDSSSSEEQPPSDGTNPFENPDPDMEKFPLPEDLPPGAGTFAVPKAGPWSVVNLAGQMACGAMSLDIPASPPENGIIEVSDGGRTLIGTGLQEDQATITLRADPEISGRYSGAFDGMEQGVPVTINYFWQVVTEEYIVGFLTASVTSEGITCNVYRPYELTYTG